VTQPVSIVVRMYLPNKTATPVFNKDLQLQFYSESKQIRFPRCVKYMHELC